MAKIKICPICGSTHIHYVAGMITGEKYKCEDCGYIGSLIVEIDEEDYEKWLEEMKARNMEVEIKAKIKNRDEIERKLKDIGAEFIKEVGEKDEYFNHPCRNFASTDEALRIRNDYTLTYKGPKVDKDTKSREEINLKIENLKDARKLLISLGFKSVAKVVKRRRYYKMGEINISVDNLPELGDFVEVECIGEYEPCKKKVMEFAKELGLKDFIRKSYLELVLEAREE